MLTHLAKQQLSHETMEMACKRVLGEITHDEFIDWMGEMERKYPGIGWEEAAFELDRHHRDMTAERVVLSRRTAEATGSAA